MSNTPEQKREQLRRALYNIGYYPTEQGVEMMQDPEEQASVRVGLLEDLDKLEPADMFAIRVLVSSLTLPRRLSEQLKAEPAQS